MKKLQYSFISENNTRQTLEHAMNTMIHSNPGIASDKSYWLYYYVKTDYDLILNSLWNYDLESDFLGFPSQQRVIRHQIEAFLDLYNLAHDRDYMTVLQLNNKENQDLGRYRKYLGTGSFFNSIQKLKIARENGFRYSKYLESFSVNANRYVHPNVFINTMSEEEKEELLRSLINASIFLVWEAFQVMMEVYPVQAEKFVLECDRCACDWEDRDCRTCIERQVKEDRYFVDASDHLFYKIYAD